MVSIIDKFQRLELAEKSFLHHVSSRILEKAADRYASKESLLWCQKVILNALDKARTPLLIAAEKRVT